MQILRFPGSIHFAPHAIALFVTTIALTVVWGAVSEAASPQSSTDIRCHATDGRGIAEAPTAAAKADETPAKFKPWVMSGEGLDLRDKINLFWHRDTDGRPTMRVAIDGPVSKPAHLLSITDDTVIAVVLTSDGDTTRPWLFTINFARKQVLASGMASNSNQLVGQLMTLACTFTTLDSGTEPSANAADHWRTSGD